MVGSGDLNGRPSDFHFFFNTPNDFVNEILSSIMTFFRSSDNLVSTLVMDPTKPCQTSTWYDDGVRPGEAGTPRFVLPRPDVSRSGAKLIPCSSNRLRNISPFDIDLLLIVRNRISLSFLLLNW